MATQQEIEQAKKYYTQEQINQELANPGSVKRVDALGATQYEQMVNGQFASATKAPTTPAPKIPDVGQQSNGVNAQGETIYNFGTITTPRQTPTVPPGTPTIPNAPVPGSVSSILGDGFGAEDPFISQYTQDQLNQYNQVIDETAIRKQKESELQAQIDAINAVYADRLRQEQTKGQGRLGSGRALQARSGLLNSDFGTAQTENISQLNREQEQSVENERLALVNQLLSGAAKSAADEIAAKRLAKEAGGKAYLDYLAGASTRKAEKVSKAAQLLLSLGKSPTDISDEELKQAGISRQDLTMEYTAGKSAQEAAAEKLAREEERRQLENIKLGAEGDKIAADINRQNAELLLKQIETGKAYVAGGFIFDGATNEVIGNAQAVKKATGGGGSGGGSGTYTINGQTYNSQLYSGLKSPTATAVRGQVGAFKSEPIVTNFNQIQEGYLLTKSLDNKTKNPTDDQALIYSLAKTLDPGSVVREGEYATVQKYAQSWKDAYGKGVEQALNGTGFLSEQARKNIKATIESKYNTSKKTYENLSNQYIKGINDLTGRQDGDKFIRDYAVEQSSDVPQTGGGTGTGNSNNPLGI